MLRALSRRDVVALLALMAAAALHALYFDHIADDAYISFRYAANWAAGRGIVFNPGEYVMGYSNFLWVSLIAAGEWLGVPGPTAAPLLGLGFGWGLLALVYAHVHASTGSSGAGFGAALLLATNGTFAMWLTGGLEGPLYGLLLTASVVEAIHLDRLDRLDRFDRFDRPDAGGPLAPSRYLRLGLWLGLAAITRPEGVFYGIAIGGALWLRRPSVARARGVAVALATSLLGFVLLTGWIYAYYGDPLPNPYYTKYHPLSWDVLWRGLGLSWWFVAGFGGMPVVVFLAWVVFCGRRWASPGWLPLAVIAAFMVFFIRVGGDGQAYYRMWFWTLPMFALLLGETLATLAASPQRAVRAWSRAFVAAIAFANVQHSVTGDELARVRHDEALTRDVIAIAAELARQHPGALVAANNVGVLSYVSGLEVIDMLGLTDRHIARAPGKSVKFPAHESHDGAYVLGRRPDIIFYRQPLVFDEPRLGDDWIAIGYPSDIDLREDPRFARDYAFEHLRLRDGRYVPLFRRRVEGGPGVRAAPAP